MRLSVGQRHNIPRGVLWGPQGPPPPLVCYWLTSVEINKHKIFDTNMLESLNYSFRNPKNIIWVIYRIKQLRNYKKNHGVLRGPQLGIQRWRARLGILRVKIQSDSNTVQLFTMLTVSQYNTIGQLIARNNGGGKEY